LKLSFNQIFILSLFQGLLYKRRMLVRRYRLMWGRYFIII